MKQSSAFNYITNVAIDNALPLEAPVRMLIFDFVLISFYTVVAAVSPPVIVLHLTSNKFSKQNFKSRFQS